MSSEGCTLNSGRSSQRRAPFTSRPNPGISTSTRSATPPRSNAGAACCQSRAGTRNTVMAASRATPRNMPWRARNQAALFPVYPLASAVAMEEEYTITRPVAASRRAAQASERSYSALGALRAKTYVRLTPAASSPWRRIPRRDDDSRGTRSEEHTSELQSHHDLVCRLLLEKKNKKKKNQHQRTGSEFRIRTRIHRSSASVGNLVLLDRTGALHPFAIMQTLEHYMPALSGLP